MSKKIIFSVGEISADRHGARLVSELKTLLPDVELLGMGGQRMKDAGADIRFDVTTMSSVGILEYYDFYKDLDEVSDKMFQLITNEKPDLVILMDMEGFNLDLAKKIKKYNIPTLYYITPQRWVLRFIGDMFTRKLSKNVTKIITMFEDEQRIYKKLGADAIYLGNPIVDSIEITKSEKEIKQIFNVKSDEIMISILPGSRKQEVKNFTDLLLKAAEKISKQKKSKFVIPISHESYRDFLEERISYYKKNFNLEVIITEQNSHNIINASDILMLSSGSATLEAAIMEKPMVIIYQISSITYLMGRLLYKFKFIGLPNLILNKNVVPELLQRHANPDKISKEILNILDDETKIKNIKFEFNKLKNKIGGKGVVKKVAKEIIKMIGCDRS